MLGFFYATGYDSVVEIDQVEVSAVTESDNPCTEAALNRLYFIIPSPPSPVINVRNWSLGWNGRERGLHGSLGLVRDCR